jgi:hypothetical protein
VNRERTIQQANKHFFAGMGLSAGYTRKINKRLSFSVEPYAKLPLKGIGYGKVNLSSSGVLFSLGVHPFNARNK